MSLFDQKKHMMVLFCSPNSHGSTRMLLDSFMGEFKDRGDWQVSETNVYELNAHPCTGCRACAKKEKCTYDDLDKFDKELRKCDLLVVASPVYNDSFPSPMKAVLDRSQRYFEARFSLGIRQPVKKHRDAVLLLTMGQEEDFPVEVTAHQLQRAFSVMNTTLRGCAVWDGTDLGRKNLGPAQQKARALALEILEDM
ncbi:flavodoxin family protein [Acutalibacter sp. 1XD8-36]|uniref:flavodoxin family protein n=1 Tax=Acutalibacter sp. 1XD8-36 TaxID=2320852 RepID=UPI0026185806|nr:flavodoxin family protein [Acutalibacter sp. 1XD8-36]